MTLKRSLLYLILMALIFPVSAQISVHMEQSARFGAMGNLSDAQWDSIHGYAKVEESARAGETGLQKRVFGYQPYWGGSAWKNYRWDLLSDLCYFSYEVDPATGNALTTHNWETASVIDTALAHGVKVHLCVTLFSGHSAFFSNPQAQNTLTGNLINMLIARGAHGINLDFEAVPSSQQTGLTNYITLLSQALHAALPEAELSIAAPAVNWNNTFNMPAIAPWLDMVVIMAYDFYWDGSSMAGPVSGYWPLTSAFNYGVNRSLTYYQSVGVPPEKILLGLPYYGREWPVTANTLPAGTTGSGVAVLYSAIRSNSGGYYSLQNLYWDFRSFNPYYSYFTTGWRQCFFDDVRSLGVKYDLVNRRGTGGIGIWALGYDNGRTELWELIENKFANPPADLCSDTISDSGGPWWSYGSDETYVETIRSAWEGPLVITFESLSLEAGFDSLWIYDGTSDGAPLLAALTGTEIPESLSTTGSSFTIKFRSDGSNNQAGYVLAWNCPTAGIPEAKTDEIKVYPNPAAGFVYVSLNRPPSGSAVCTLTDLSGRTVAGPFPVTTAGFGIPVQNLKPGIYLLTIRSKSHALVEKLVIENQ